MKAVNGIIGTNNLLLNPRNAQTFGGMTNIYIGDADMSILSKKCTKCGETKSQKEFAPDKRRRDGLQSHCRDCQNEYRALHPEIYLNWSARNPGIASQRAYEWNKAHKERFSTRHSKYRRTLREEAIQAYGGKCSCCGEARYEFLALDHVEGGGGVERKAIHGANIYKVARDEGYPPRFRLLCHNCNSAIGFYGYCPHSKGRQ